MAINFVHENGTGLTAATAYCNTPEAAQYFEDTGRKAVWGAYSTAEKQGAINSATAYMDDVYGDRYLGDLPESTGDTQGLLWPRENVPNDRGGFYPGLGNEIPAPVHQACAEFALALLQNGTGSLYPATAADGRAVKVAKVRVEGAVSKETEYDGGNVQPTRRKYPLAENKIRAVITTASRYLLRA